MLIKKYIFITAAYALCLLPQWTLGSSAGSQTQESHSASLAISAPVDSLAAQHEEHPTVQPTVSAVFDALPFEVRKQFYYNDTYHVPTSLQDLREKLKLFAVTKLLCYARKSPNAHSQSLTKELATAIHQGQGRDKPRPYNNAKKENNSAILNTALANVRGALGISAESPSKFVKQDPAVAAATSERKKAKIRNITTQIEAQKSKPEFSSKPATPDAFKPKQNKRKEPSQ